MCVIQVDEHLLSWDGYLLYNISDCNEFSRFLTNKQKFLFNCFCCRIPTCKNTPNILPYYLLVLNVLNRDGGSYLSQEYLHLVVNNVSLEYIRSRVATFRSPLMKTLDWIVKTLGHERNFSRHASQTGSTSSHM